MTAFQYRWLADGGKYLECFDTYLPKVYGRAGFEKVAAVPFDPNFAPEGWSYEDMAEYNGGKPDVVLMIPIGSGKKFRRFDALTALNPMQPVEPPDWLLDSSVAKKQWEGMNSEERDWVAANADDIRGEYSETMPATILGLLYAGA